VSKKRKPAINPVTGAVQCPNCGGAEFRYLEDIRNYREVLRQRTDAEGRLIATLEIDSYYRTDGCDDGTNPRLQCQKCYEDLPIPEGIRLEFVCESYGPLTNLSLALSGVPAARQSRPFRRR
jgi:hypothetical protein